MGRLPIVVALSGLAACAADDTATASAPVIGGTITPGGALPAVGAVWVDGGLECTGTLIRADVVLTAAHCVDRHVLGGVMPGFTLDKDTMSAPPTVVAGRAYVQADGFDLAAPYAPGLGAVHDLGLLWLAAPIDGVTPMAIATPAEAAAALAPDLPVTIVGYGRISNDPGPFGVEYDAIAPVVSWNDQELQVGDGASPQPCNGDSGGPAIADLGAGPRVLGVVSRTFTADHDCLHGVVDTRADAYLAWVEAQLAAPCPGCADAGVDGPTADAGAAADGGAGGCSTGGDRGCVWLFAAALALGGWRLPRRARRR